MFYLRLMYVALFCCVNVFYQVFVFQGDNMGLLLLLNCSECMQSNFWLSAHRYAWQARKKNDLVYKVHVQYSNSFIKCMHDINAILVVIQYLNS